jgi:hypothetical protein
MSLLLTLQVGVTRRLLGQLDGQGPPDRLWLRSQTTDCIS